MPKSEGLELHVLPKDFQLPVSRRHRAGLFDEFVAGLVGRKHEKGTKIRVFKGKVPTRIVYSKAKSLRAARARAHAEKCFDIHVRTSPDESAVFITVL